MQAGFHREVSGPGYLWLPERPHFVRCESTDVEAYVVDIAVEEKFGLLCGGEPMIISLRLFLSNSK